jgi:acyl carrier protein phosphodiesterase
VVATRMVESLSHANIRLPFGWLGERLLVSPRFHRVHHAIGVGHEGKYHGVNFAVLFPIWDILFRTADFRAETTPTGISDQLTGADYGHGWWQQQWFGMLRLMGRDPHRPPNNAAFQLGNLLADEIPKPVRSALPAAVQAGIAAHHMVDRFTDTHPLVKQSHGRLPPTFLRYAGPVMDLYYDHLLCCDWARLMPHVPLAQFTARFYAEAQPFAALLPDNARNTLARISEHDALGAYRSVDAVTFALNRIAARWQARFGRKIDLAAAVPYLEASKPALQADFRAFFPQLAAHCSASSQVELNSLV